MKAIKNLHSVPSLLDREDPKWQRRVYDHTGVIPIPHKNGRGIDLLSACGYIDLDDDAVYKHSKGQDLTNYCEILSIDALTKYILEMESYQAYLIDYSLGSFSKAELFWGVWSTLISPKTNQLRPGGSCSQDWGLYHIQIYQNYIDLHMPLIEYNDCTIWIKHDPSQSLVEALEAIAKEMNNVTADMDEIPVCRVIHNELQPPPRSFEALYSKLCPGGEFDWLG